MALSSSDSNENEARAPEGTHREVLRVAWPLVVSMISYTVMGLTDTLLVAQLGTTEVAAVGLASTATFALACFGLGLLGSVKVVVAQATGAGEHERTLTAAFQGVTIAFVLGSLVLMMIPIADEVMTLLGGGGRVASLGGDYLAIRLLGALPMYLGTASFGWFEGRGDTRTPMYVMLVSNGLNIVLDLLLIFGAGPIPALGTDGAAIATAISLLVQGGTGLSLFLWRTRGRWSVRLEGIGDLLRIGLPMGVQWGLEVLSWSVFGALVARAGDAHLAAHAISVRILSMSFLPGHAISDATSILVGQAVGAKAPEAARRAADAAMRVCLVVMGLMGLVFLLGGELLLLPFRPEPEVLRVGGQLMVWAAAFQLFDAVAMTRQGALNGAADTRWVMLACITLSWSVMLPVAWVLCTRLGWGAPGAWIGLTAYIIVLSATLWARWQALTAPEGAVYNLRHA